MTDNAPHEQGQQSHDGAAAELMPRFLARLIDSIILAIVMYVVLVPLIIGAIFTAPTGVGAFGGFGIYSLMIGIVFAALIIGYFAFLESSRGQTIGKMVMKLRTEGPDGHNPSFEVAVKRNAFYALGVLPLLGGFLQLAAVLYIAYTINESPTHTGWHDEFAGGTKVVKVG